eukprot:12631115-Heterocapsa_arctica.AAC.1
MAPPAQVAVLVVDVPRPRGRCSRPQAKSRSFASQVRPSIFTPHRLHIYAGSRALDRSLPSIARKTLSSRRPSMLAP